MGRGRVVGVYISIITDLFLPLQQFAPASYNDGKLEVVGISGVIHMVSTLELYICTYNCNLNKGFPLLVARVRFTAE